MAAGMGSRFGSLKQLALLGPHQKTLLHYSIYDALHSGFDKVVFIIRKSFEKEFREAVGKYCRKPRRRPITVFRKWIVYRAIYLPSNEKNRGERLMPYGPPKRRFRNLLSLLMPMIFTVGMHFKKCTNSSLIIRMTPVSALAGYRLDSTLSENGSVSRGICTFDRDLFMTSITECTKIIKDNDGIKDIATGRVLRGDDIVSMNFWGFTPMLFEEIEKQFIEFYRQNKTNPKAEIYIPSVVDTLLNRKEIKVKILKTNAKWFGVTYKEDTDFVNQALNRFETEGVYTDINK